MKTMIRIIAMAIYIFSPLLLQAQAPMKFNYQGVVRSAGGLPVTSQAVGLKLSILDGSPVGTAQYVEMHTVNTNQFGLFIVTVGGGIAITGSMNDVTWASGDKYLKVEFDPLGGTVYTDLGATQLLSVPYALTAKQLDTIIPLLPFADTLTSSVPLLTIGNQGDANVAQFSVDNVNGTSAALKAVINSQNDNLGTAAVYGIAEGAGGIAGLFRATNPLGHATALSAFSFGTGDGLFAGSTNGNGIEAQVHGLGAAIHAWVPNFAGGRAASFENFNAANTQSLVVLNTNGIHNALFINHSGASGNLAVLQNSGSNVARIDKTGKGFFNGGTQNFGADLAEAFDVSGTADEYEPGDVLVIATNADRTVEKSSGAYSTLVAGVYATRPGVLLTEEDIDSDLSGTVPMGVVGVIPTKVCDQNGVIRRGDLLVTSSIAGHAMKADMKKLRTGQVIGKALEEFNGKGTGKIKVLVNVK